MHASAARFPHAPALAGASFDESAEMGHPYRQGNPPGAGSSTQRPAPAPLIRPGRSGSICRRAVDRSQHCRPAACVHGSERFSPPDVPDLDRPPTRRTHCSRGALRGPPAPAAPLHRRRPPLLRHERLHHAPRAGPALRRRELPHLRVPPPGRVANRAERLRGIASRFPAGDDVDGRRGRLVDK